MTTKHIINRSFFLLSVILLSTLLNSCRSIKGGFTQQKYTNLKPIKTTSPNNPTEEKPSNEQDAPANLFPASTATDTEFTDSNPPTPINPTLEISDLNENQVTASAPGHTNSDGDEGNTPVEKEESVKQTESLVSTGIHPLQVAKKSDPSMPDPKLRTLGVLAIISAYLGSVGTTFAGIFAVNSLIPAFLIGGLALALFLIGALLLKQAFRNINEDGAWRKERKNAWLYLMLTTIILALGTLLTIFLWTGVAFIPFAILAAGSLFLMFRSWLKSLERHKSERTITRKKWGVISVGAFTFFFSLMLLSATLSTGVLATIFLALAGAALLAAIVAFVSALFQTD